MEKKQTEDWLSGSVPQAEPLASAGSAYPAPPTGNTTCRHEQLSCADPFDFLPVFECPKCGALLICQCEVQWFERFDPSRLRRRVFQRTTGETKEATPARNVCYVCRGVEEPYAPVAYGRHLFSRKRWRAIMKRHIELLDKYRQELNGLRAKVELTEGELRVLLWPDVEAGRFKAILRHPVVGKPLLEMAPDRRPLHELQTWKTVSNTLLVEFRDGISVLAGERLRALEQFAAEFKSYRTRLSEIECEAENDVRQASGVPLIGQGWITETELFNLTTHLFAPSLVIQHARLPWLGRQHLDVYVPDYALAIEYMGEQHTEALDHFGGEEGLRAREELDRRKRELCRTHGVDLIEVTPDDEISLASLERILGRYLQKSANRGEPEK